MAGIGFRINKLLRSDDLYSKPGGAIASVIISSGPWLCTILSIALISFLGTDNENPVERQVFRVIINYTYAGSLIGFALLEMVTVRYIADAIYMHQEKVIPTIYTLVVAAIMAASTAAGYGFYHLTHLNWHECMVATTLLTLVTIIWAAMMFLSACKDYLRISLAFLAGLAISTSGAYILAYEMRLGLIGKLGGFALGQLFIAVTLSYRIYQEFGMGFLFPRDYLGHVRRNYKYIFVAVFYNCAVWVDKIVFWLAPPTSERVAPYFFKSSIYDAAVFLAYLFIVPAMAYFMVSIETSFYLAYRKYFSLIDNRAPYSLVEAGRKEIIQVTRKATAGLVLFQTFITVPALILAPQLVGLVGLPSIYAVVFRYAIIGSSLHIYCLFVNILIQYFDLAGKAARNFGIFFVLNFSLSFVSAMFLDYRYHGLGYAVAALISLVVSLVSLRKVLFKLNFLIFMKQPISRPAHLPLLLENFSLGSK